VIINYPVAHTQAKVARRLMLLPALRVCSGKKCWYPLVISHSCGNLIKLPMYFDVFDLLNIANFPWYCYQRASFHHFLSNSCLQHQKSPSIPWFWGLISDNQQQSSQHLCWFCINVKPGLNSLGVDSSRLYIIYIYMCVCVYALKIIQYNYDDYMI
jgi:hypothetical protein